MATRVKILAKLGLLIGGPVAILSAIFGTGMYCGTQSRHGVLAFERDVLGMDVEVPPPEVEEAEPGGKKTALESAKAQAAKSAAVDLDEPASQPPPVRDRLQPTKSPTPAPTVQPAVDPSPSLVVEPASAPNDFPIAIPEPIADEALSKRLGSIRSLDVKVLVDPDLVSERPDWIAYSTQLVQAASRSYKNVFGIELRLVGVVKWDVATAALDRAQMREDLEARPAEGADIIVALTAHGVEDERGPSPTADGHENDAFAVVYADRRERAPHLRPLLRELGHLFGAADVTDAQSDAYQRGSWMSRAPVPAGSTPWIDLVSRRSILERKDLPFPEAK